MKTQNQKQPNVRITKTQLKEVARNYIRIYNPFAKAYNANAGRHPSEQVSEPNRDSVYSIESTLNALGLWEQVYEVAKELEAKGEFVIEKIVA